MRNFFLRTPVILAPEAHQILAGGKRVSAQPPEPTWDKSGVPEGRWRVASTHSG